jgi:hypothetical protein
MKKHNTQLALPLLAALITLQSTQAANILVDDFSSTSVDSNAGGGRLIENDINLGWDAHFTSSWAITGGVLTNTNTTAGAVGSEGGVAQVFSYGPDANTEVTLSFDYDVTAGDTLYVQLWGIDGTYDATNSHVVNHEVTGGGMYWSNQDTAVEAYALQGGGANPGAAMATLSGIGTFSTTINIADLGVSGVTTAGDFEYYMVGFARDIGATPGTTSIDNLSFTSVPEPSSTALLGLGGLALILRRRK